MLHPPQTPSLPHSPSLTCAESLSPLPCHLTLLTSSLANLPSTPTLSVLLQHLLKKPPRPPPVHPPSVDSLIPHQLSPPGARTPGHCYQWSSPGMCKPRASVAWPLKSTFPQHGWAFLRSLAARELPVSPSRLWLLSGLPSQVLSLFLSFIYSTYIHRASVMCARQGNKWKSPSCMELASLGGGKRSGRHKSRSGVLSAKDHE